MPGPGTGGEAAFGANLVVSSRNVAFYNRTSIAKATLRDAMLEVLAVAVRYRNSYFWIDDRELGSKRIFSFLMFVFTLAETGEKGTAPVVTIPTG
jgi:hypothetical protein